MHRVEKFLNEITAGLNLPDENLKEIQEELLCHVADAKAAKIAEGVKNEEAELSALMAMGKPTELRGLYRATYLKQHLIRVISRIAGIASLAWLIYYSAAYINAGMSAYFNPMAILMTPLGATLLLMGSFRIKDLCHALAAPFCLCLNSKSLNWNLVADLYRTWVIYMLGCGIFAAALGVTLSCHLMDRSLPIGPGLALAMMGLVYGALLSGVLWTFALSLPNTEQNPTDYKRTKPIRAMIVMTAFFGITAFTWHQVFPYSCNYFHFVFFLPAIIFVLIGVLGLALATFGFRGTIEALHKPDKIRILGAYFAIIGLVGFVNHLVLGLITLVSMDKIHLGIAKATLPPMYGIIACLFCWMLAGPWPRPSARNSSKIPHRVGPA